MLSGYRKTSTGKTPFIKWNIQKKKLRRADKLMINVLRRKYEAEKIEKKKNLIFY